MAAFHRGPGGSDDINDAVRRRLAEALRRLEHADDCLDDDPDRAGRLIRSALAYAKIGDAELQTAIAQIYLRVLTDDGLAPAVSALARLFPMSTTVDVDPRRLAQPVEAAAYLLIAETLTTVHEQAEAHRVHVAAYSAGADLAVEISYDGADAFGADRMAELRRRIEAFDATLAIVTQAGIGTRVRATFPRASALS